MIEVSLELIIALIGAITGIIGTITGIINLIWHIQIDKPKLILDRAYFEWASMHDKNPPRDKEIIKFEMVLDNLSNRSTTIKDIWFQVGDRIIMEKYDYSFNPQTIRGGSSKIFTFYIDFDKKDFRNYFDKDGKIELGVDIFHTFGRIKKTGYKTRFGNTGWLNIPV
ncbi:MAG: hypothetical protein M1416_03305 [Candidatus Pacearchaeota archaeon]|nr:hypothetical protein [Candidatus Pacearchaeota archaeon]